VAFICKERGASRSPYEGGDSGIWIIDLTVDDRGEKFKVSM
jgi:hypothetical protein